MDFVQKISNAVVPLTGNVGRLYPSEVVVDIQRRSSNAMADQITTASKERLTTRLGALSAEDLRAVEQAVKFQLGLRL